MKIAYFDCFSGISGDMIIGALLDAGLDIDALEKELGKLGLPGYSISYKKVSKNHLTGTKFDVAVTEKQTNRHWRDIKSLIEKSGLDNDVKDTSLQIFVNLAGAEAEIHGVPVEEVHFHEVGAVDSIVDIVGTAVALKQLGIEEVSASKIHVGSGFVNTQHGKLPVPVPATIRLLEDKPVYSTGIEAELVTPTGAAVLTTLAGKFGDMPEMMISSVGYGAGNRDLPVANLLRVIIGEKNDGGYERDEITLIETNLDDVSGEVVGYTVEKLFAAGALDVYTTPIYMKKNRPGIKLTVIAKTGNVDKLSDIIFEETSTFGIRYRNFRRKKMKRRIEKIEIKYGTARVKIGEPDGRVFRVVPEYEDCARLAEENGVPISNIYEEVKKAISGKYGK